MYILATAVTASTADTSIVSYNRDIYTSNRWENVEDIGVGWLTRTRACVSSCGGWLCVCVCIRMDATISIIAFSTSMQFVSEKTCCLMLAGRYSKRMDKIENIPLTLFYGVGPTDDNRCAFSKAPTMKKICCGFVFEVGKRAGCDVIS